jgi:hypothetical protein
MGGPIEHAMAGKTYDPRYRDSIVHLIGVLRSADYEVISSLEEGYLDGCPVLIPPNVAAMRDFEAVAGCDAYLCIWPIGELGIPYRSDGTCIELGWASGAHKPCFIIRDLNAKVSDLIKGLGSVTKVIHLAFDECINSPTLLLDSLKGAGVTTYDTERI